MAEAEPSVHVTRLTLRSSHPSLVVYACSLSNRTGGWERGTHSPCFFLKRATPQGLGSPAFRLPTNSTLSYILDTEAVIEVCEDSGRLCVRVV